MVLILFLSFLLLAKPVSALEISQTKSVTISASIGENEVTIFGYTSPNSRVELTGINIYSLTFSQNNGYFEFNKVVLPKSPKDLCFQSQDNSYRYGNLVCIPPPPANNYHTNIGPIILPPTISIEPEKIQPNSLINSSGQSIPNSIVHIFFYKVKDSARSFPKPAFAYSLPTIQTTTDSNGNYSFNLPTAYASDFRFYTSVEYDGQPSPKSNTLLYFMPQYHSYLMIIIPAIFFILLIATIFLFLKNPTQKQISPRLLPAIRNFYPSIRSFYPDSIRRSAKIPK